MKTAILIFLCFIFFKTFSQSLDSRSSKINYGFFLIPEWNVLALKSTQEKESATSKFGFSTGMIIEFCFNKNVFFSSGIGYAKKKYNHTQSGLVFGTDIDPQIGIISESKLISNLNYSEIYMPFLFKYKWTKFDFGLCGGVDISYPFSDHTERTVFYGNGNEEKLNNANLKMLNVSPVLSLTYYIRVSDKQDLLIEPMFKYYLKEYIISNANVCSLGMKISFVF